MTSVLQDERLFDVTNEALTSAKMVPVGSAKTFRHYDPTQSFLMPPSLDDWLPEDHTARFVSEVVSEIIDLSAIYDSYIEASGAPPYDPKMMLKLLIFGYSTGVTSSREIERRCHVDVAFRWLAANTTPDYRSISRFRRRHLVVIDDLFTQVLVLCAEAGLVSLGRIALDGTKLRASASKHKAMSHDRLGPRIEELKAEVKGLLAEAEVIDRDEDDEFGEDRRGDEIPKELARRETRLAKMRAAKEAIEKAARDKAADKAAEAARNKGADEKQAQQAADRAAKTAKPEGRAQRNFTDPDSRMMKTNSGFEYAYNAQAVVDEASQVVLSADVVQTAADVNQLVPMIEATIDKLEEIGIDDRPEVTLADAGYWSEENFEIAAQNGHNVLIATGRMKHGEQVTNAPRGPIPKNATQKQRMARRLRTNQGRSDYARRKAIVEPVFGQMKVRQSAGQLRLRGLEGAKGEWMLHVLCHNLRKLAKVDPINILRFT